MSACCAAACYQMLTDRWQTSSCRSSGYSRLQLVVHSAALSPLQVQAMLEEGGLSSTLLPHERPGGISDLLMGDADDPEEAALLSSRAYQKVRAAMADCATHACTKCNDKQLFCVAAASRRGVRPAHGRR